MPETVVTVKGKDELSQILDDIEKRAERLGVTTDRLAGFGNQTTTQQKQSLGGTQSDILEKQKEQIRKEHEEQRRLNEEEFAKSKQALRDKKITRGEFDVDKARYENAQSESKADEENELKQVEKESLLQLKLISRTLIERDRIDREQKQRENKEFNEARKNGHFGKMEAEKNELEKKMLTAPDEESYKMHKKQLDALKEKMGVTQSGGGGGMFGGDEMGQVAMAMSSGNVLGLVVKRFWPLMIAGAGVALAKAAENNDNEYSHINAFQGGDLSNKKRLQNEYRQKYVFGGTKELTTYGISDDDMAKNSQNMARSSGMMGDLFERTFKSSILEKATGVDNLSQYAGFDRQDKDGKSIADNTLEMINILTGIKNGSLKPNDLLLLAEKLQVSNQLSAYQFQRQDKVDRQQIMQQMAAAEMFFGASGRDQRAGDLISGVNQNAASGGGNQNLEWMKWMAARKSHPEMNDEQLAGLMEVGTDANYQKAYYGMYKNISGKEGTYGSFMAKKAMLQGLTVEQRNQGLGPNGALLNEEYYNPLLTSKLKESGAKMDYQDAADKAAINTPAMSKMGTELMQVLKTDIGMHLSNVAQSLVQMNTKLDTGTLKVVDVSPKTTSNTTKTGK